MIKESITKTGEKVQTDVAAEIFIEKHPLTDELDVDMVLTIDPKSEKPMNVNVEAELVSEEATVTGTATGKDKGKAVIETEVHHSDYYEKNHKSATDSKDITLDLTKKNKASDAHDLDATADDVDLKKEKKKKGSKWYLISTWDAFLVMLDKGFWCNMSSSQFTCSTKVCNVKMLMIKKAY